MPILSWSKILTQYRYHLISALLCDLGKPRKIYWSVVPHVRRMLMNSLNQCRAKGVLLEPFPSQRPSKAFLDGSLSLVNIKMFCLWSETRSNHGDYHRIASKFLQIHSCAIGACVRVRCLCYYFRVTWCPPITWGDQLLSHLHSHSPRGKWNSSRDPPTKVFFSLLSFLFWSFPSQFVIPYLSAWPFMMVSRDSSPEGHVYNKFWAETYYITASLMGYTIHGKVTDWQTSFIFWHHLLLALSWHPLIELSLESEGQLTRLGTIRGAPNRVFEDTGHNVARNVIGVPMA